MKSKIQWVWMLCLSLFAINLSYAADESSHAGDTFDCVVQPNATIKLGSEEEGILEKTLVQRGDLVKKGEPLAQLDSDVERLTAELAKLHSENDTDIRSGQAQFQFRSREKDRIHELVKDHSVAETDFDKSQVEADLAQLSVESARIKQKIATVEYQRAEQLLEGRTIRSPVDGVVVDVLMFPGEYVNKQTPLMTIAAVDPLYVEAFAPVADYGQITKDMTATVMPEKPVGGAYPAKVAVVDRVFDPASRTFRVRLLLPNARHRLPAGMRCTVKFKKVTKKGSHPHSATVK